MGRPDERLLLRADKVRRVPEGARVWHARDEYVPGVLGGGAATTRGEPIVVWWSDIGAENHSASELALDLSAPADGERVDLLPWALRELNPSAVSARMQLPRLDAPGLRVDSEHGAICAYVARALVPLVAACLVKPIALDDRWPDLTGLSDADAARAVVVAALGVARG